VFAPILQRNPAPMQGNIPLRHVYRSLALAVLLSLLAACGTTPVKQAPATGQAQATVLEQQGKYADAARIYEDLAAAAQGTQRAEFQVSAAEDWSSAGDGKRSWAALAEIKPADLYPALQARIEIVKAELDLAAHQPQTAFAHLTFPLTPLPDELKAKTLLVRGQVHVALGDVPDAVQDWSQRDQYLGGAAAAVHANHESIWQLLTQTHLPLNLASLPPGLSTEARAWLELADIARNNWQQPEKFIAQLQGWQAQYTGHPANSDVVPDLLAKQRALSAYPAHIAVLLPLSGNYQAAADAVRDGVLAAYYSAGSSAPPAVALYDSGSSADSAQAAYRQAVADGANMVLGPLTKDTVSGVAALPSLAAPVLALNYLDTGKTTPSGFYQFGLLPEDEAAQAAERAVADGYQRGVALVPNDDWGKRMLAAFSARFAEAHGTLLDAETYTPNNKVFSSDPITRMLSLDDSHARAQQLASTLGKRLDFEPRRRQDVQFIFLAAGPDDAQQIGPQFGYNRANDVPVYSTSRIYQLSSNTDNSLLNGISFDDMPWVLDQGDTVATIRGAVSKDWPSNFADNSRLYALGFDAYRLVPLLYNTHQITEPMQGMTGLLSLGPDGRLHRQLDWAEFDDGEPKPLAPAAPALTPAAMPKPTP
jgi:outer membrane PBP1 activator LpoA protein